MGEGRWGRGRQASGGRARWLELREQQASLAPPCAGFYLETRSCGWKHCPPFLLGTGSRAEDGKGASSLARKIPSHGRKGRFLNMTLIIFLHFLEGISDRMPLTPAHLSYIPLSLFLMGDND